MKLQIVRELHYNRMKQEDKERKLEENSSFERGNQIGQGLS